MRDGDTYKSDHRRARRRVIYRRLGYIQIVVAIIALGISGVASLVVGQSVFVPFLILAMLVAPVFFVTSLIYAIGVPFYLIQDTPRGRELALVVAAFVISVAVLMVGIFLLPLLFTA